MTKTYLLWFPVSRQERCRDLVPFHELGPRLTRVLRSFDVDPGSWREKAPRGMRHIKRAVRGDLHRFKAFVEMQQDAAGDWRGTIEDGEIVKSRAGGSSSSPAPRGSSSSGGAASHRSRSRTRASSNGRSHGGSGSHPGRRSGSRGSRRPLNPEGGSGRDEEAEACPTR